MTNKFKYIIILILFALIFNCSVKRIKKKKESINYPDMVQVNYDHFIYKNSKKYLHAKIKHADFFKKLDTIECEGLRAEIYNSKGELTTIINADKGIVYKKEKKIYFTENVMFELLENETKLISEELILDYKDNKLTSNSDVLIKKDDGSYIKATSMESEIKLDSTKFEDMEVKYFYEDDDEEDEKKSTDNKKIKSVD